MLTIKRTGNFNVVLTGEFHCGMTPINQFDYSVSITVEDSALDERGFIIDNKDIDTFFQNIQKTSLSCELLTRAAARHYFKAINKPSEIIEIRVQIWGLRNVAYIEYCYDRSKESSKSLESSEPSAKKAK